MSYDPSHRLPPRQERWPNATPAEGWPSYELDASHSPNVTAPDALMALLQRILSD